VIVEVFFGFLEDALFLFGELEVPAVSHLLPVSLGGYSRMTLACSRTVSFLTMVAML
jgi:hypothetical protein